MHKMYTENCCTKCAQRTVHKHSQPFDVLLTQSYIIVKIACVAYIMKQKKENLKKKLVKPREKIVFRNSEYAVIKFIENRIKLFESIPESWFINEERTACYWPPKTGKSFKLRAINQDIPDWDWEIYECIVVSGGHGKYIYFCFEMIEIGRNVQVCSYLQHRFRHCERKVFSTIQYKQRRRSYRSGQI